MGILIDDIIIERGTIDFMDPDANGGSEASAFINDSRGNIFPDISATDREQGGIRRVKLFIKNGSYDATSPSPPDKNRVLQHAAIFLKQDIMPPDRLFIYEASSNTSVEADEDFVNGKKYVNSPLRSAVTFGSTEIFIPIVDKDNFVTGDTIIINDSYFRQVHRCDISNIIDHGSDPDIAVITLSKPYNASVDIASNTGSVSTAIVQTIAPNETKSFWVEMTFLPSSAMDSEFVGNLKIGLHYDDVEM